MEWTVSVVWMLSPSFGEEKHASGWIQFAPCHLVSGLENQMPLVFYLVEEKSVAPCPNSTSHFERLQSTEPNLREINTLSCLNQHLILTDMVKQ